MSNYTHFNLSYDDAGVAWLSMDAAGRSVNVLAQEVMAELIAAIDEVAGRAPSGFVFLSAKKRGFIFGADVNEFELFRTAAEVERISPRSLKDSRRSRSSTARQ